MSTARPSSGTLGSGLPFNRIGRGPAVVALQGLMFENRALSGIEARFVLRPYSPLAEHRAFYLVNRRPGLPRGSTLSDMAADYAAMIRAEFEGAVDVIGISSGGSIAFHLAAEHPDVVRRLVIQDCGCRQTAPGRAWQADAGRLASAGRWRDLSQMMMATVQPDNALGWAMAWLVSPLMAWSAPDDPSDMVGLIDAEDGFDFIGRLGEIAAPTLIACGEMDPFCTPDVARQTADGIAGARLIVYSKRRHGVRGKRFERDLVDFLAD